MKLLRHLVPVAKRPNFAARSAYLRVRGLEAGGVRLNPT
jgi:hypothetical protein